jgi:hypothetical protein
MAFSSPSLTRVKLKTILFDAESALTDPEVRSSRDRIEELLHPEFTETGSTGTVYDRATMIEMMLAEVPAKVMIRDFVAQRLSSDTVLTTYRSVGLSGQEARRCSIWVESAAGWRIRYHQGTRVPNSWGHVS